MVGDRWRRAGSGRFRRGYFVLVIRWLGTSSPIHFVSGMPLLLLVLLSWLVALVVLVSVLLLLAVGTVVVAGCG